MSTNQKETSSVTTKVDARTAKITARSRAEIIEEVVREIMDQGPSEGEVRTMLNNIAQTFFDRGAPAKITRRNLDELFAFVQHVQHTCEDLLMQIHERLIWCERCGEREQTVGEISQMWLRSPDGVKVPFWYCQACADAERRESNPNPHERF